MTVQPFEPATRQVIPRRIDASPNVVAMLVISGISSIGTVDTTRLPGAYPKRLVSRLRRFATARRDTVAGGANISKPWGRPGSTWSRLPDRVRCAQTGENLGIHPQCHPVEPRSSQTFSTIIYAVNVNMIECHQNGYHLRGEQAFIDARCTGV
jgi:hypothetical protein